MRHKLNSLTKRYAIPRNQMDLQELYKQINVLQSKRSVVVAVRYFKNSKYSFTWSNSSRISRTMYFYTWAILCPALIINFSNMQQFTTWQFYVICDIRTLHLENFALQSIGIVKCKNPIISPQSINSWLLFGVSCCYLLSIKEIHK